MVFRRGGWATGGEGDDRTIGRVLEMREQAGWDGCVLEFQCKWEGDGVRVD